MKRNTSIGGAITVIIIIVITAIAFISKNAGPQIQPENAGQSPLPAQVNTASDLPSNQKVIEISNFTYSPSTIKVKVGDTVTWTNRDIIDHTATASDGSFDTGLFGRNESKSVTFTKAGTYNYYCTPHPYMKGVVIVE